MDKPTLYRGDGYQPDAINETTTGNLHDLIPLLESAARLGIDVELITEYQMDPGKSAYPTRVIKRYALRVFPKLDQAEAREMLVNIALQHEKRQAAFDDMHGLAGGAYAKFVK